MIVKKGKLTSNYTWSDGTVEDAIRQTAVSTIIEKTEGNYVEILYRKDSYSFFEYGNMVAYETNNNFTVYHGKTVEQILSLNNVIGAHEWTEPLTQIS